jgi:hypothetical protein
VSRSFVSRLLARYRLEGEGVSDGLCKGLGPDLSGEH